MQGGWLVFYPQFLNKILLISVITVICGTNRPQNVTRHIASLYSAQLEAKGVEVKLLSIEDLPKDYAFNNDVYGETSEGFHQIVQEFIVPAEKLVVVTPEYNGSVPGVFKAFIDGIWPEVLRGKKAALVGVASGRAGNVRGMDHLTNIFNYLDIQVLPYKVPLSGIDALLDEDRVLKDPKALDMIDRQVEKLLVF